MSKLILLLLAATALAQTTQRAATTGRPSGLTSPSSKDIFLTGGSNQWRKVVRGNITDPANFKSYIQEASSSRPDSYWHDIPLFADQPNNIYNMIVEVPRGEAVKSLMNLGLEMNPITVVMDGDKPETENVDYIHNFGKFPQTWNNGSVDSFGQLPGNSQPLDVVEISERTHQIGDIVQVKVLGLLGVIDNEKVDWKVIVFDTNSPHAASINSLEDVDALYPDLLQATRGYFRFYRFPGQINDMLFNGQYQTVDQANKVITDKHNQWQDLIKNQTPPEGIITTSHQDGAAFKADDAKWTALLSA
jgi:inorganic pyrophosphatase